MPGSTSKPLLGKRFDQALDLAARWHVTHVRKGTSVPYLSHLMAVASLVLEDGGDEDQAIAALLHDALEEAGGKAEADARRREIRETFGDRVLRIVEGCTDTDVDPKPLWRPRKDAYLAHLRHAERDVLRVSLADKVHNARTIVMDHARVGAAVWTRFKAKADDALWYYATLAEIYRERLPGPLAGELDRLVVEMTELVTGAQVAP